MSYKKIETWNLPRKQILDVTSFDCEMSESDHGFICGLLKKYKPKKILEVGVANGGTTGVIINALNLIGEKCQMYSIDICENLYSDPSKKLDMNMMKIYQIILLTLM